MGVAEESPPTSGFLTFLTLKSLSLWISWGQIREILSAHGERKPSDYIIGQYDTAVQLFVHA
jgi:hypothetical protein